MHQPSTSRGANGPSLFPDVRGCEKTPALQAERNQTTFFFFFFFFFFFRLIDVDNELCLRCFAGKPQPIDQFQRVLA